MLEITFAPIDAKDSPLIGINNEHATYGSPNEKVIDLAMLEYLRGLKKLQDDIRIKYQHILTENIEAEIDEDEWSNNYSSYRRKIINEGLNGLYYI